MSRVSPAKAKKKVEINEDANEYDDDDEVTTGTENADDHEYAGKWRRVEKSKKSNSKEQATLDDQIRPFGRLVPNWP